jgi:hypothetical protein
MSWSCAEAAERNEGSPFTSRRHTWSAWRISFVPREAVGMHTDNSYVDRHCLQTTIYTDRHCRNTYRQQFISRDTVGMLTGNLYLETLLGYLPAAFFTETHCWNTDNNLCREALSECLPTTVYIEGHCWNAYRQSVPGDTGEYRQQSVPRDTIGMLTGSNFTETHSWNTDSNLYRKTQNAYVERHCCDTYDGNLYRDSWWLQSWPSAIYIGDAVRTLTDTNLYRKTLVGVLKDSRLYREHTECWVTTGRFEK